MRPSPKRGANFAAGYSPSYGDVVHLNFSPVVGREQGGPRYALVLSATDFNIATGLCVVSPITTQTDKLGGFEFPLQAGRVNGVVLVSQLRSVDYVNRDVQYEDAAPPAVVLEANRRAKLILP